MQVNTMSKEHITVSVGSWNLSSNESSKRVPRGLPELSLLLLVGVTLFVVLATNCHIDKKLLQRDSVIKVPAKELITHNETLDVQLEREVRILCWILTNPKNHKTKALTVKQTWGKRCTNLLFVTTKADDELDTLVVDIEEKYDYLWGKTRYTFKYLYENHLQEYDWFLKADDDTYVFMENLRYMLYSYHPETPIWFGYNYKLKDFKKTGILSYMSGGSGYILSREALRRFGDIALQTPSGCSLSENTGAEDVEMGVCLGTAGVIAGDSRDASFSLRFAIFNPDAALMSNFFNGVFWYDTQSFFHTRSCRTCLSNYAVTFHYVTPVDMRIFEYLKYELEVVGLVHPEETLPLQILPSDVVIPVSDNEM